MSITLATVYARGKGHFSFNVIMQVYNITYISCHSRRGNSSSTPVIMFALIN